MNGDKSTYAKRLLGRVLDQYHPLNCALSGVVLAGTGQNFMLLYVILLAFSFALFRLLV